MTAEPILELGHRWTEAEQHADVATLATLLADDFVAVGPRGFVLNREQWLDRYRAGDLRNDT
ncbi:MAG TPA: nuclear transport factor 2 family protein, partial [Thermomicrobiales bacterium]|nr:nuclear transport factor 2 family protein [Thermomicrobiales bacterium]